MDILTPLETWYEFDPDHSEEDQRRLLGEMIARQDALHSLLRGEVGLDYVCDMIAQHGYGIDQWMECSIQNLGYVMESGLADQVDPDEVSALITGPRYSYLVDEVNDATPSIWIPD